MSGISPLLVQREFGRAKRAWVRLVSAQFLMILLPLFSLVRHPFVAAMAAVLSFLGVVAMFILKGIADSAYERAEEARRARLIEDALGDAPDPADSMRIVADATCCPSGDPAPVGSYYNSSTPLGPARLVHVLWESAHCTEKVAREVAGHASGVSIVGGALVVALLLGTLCAGASGTVAEGVANAAVCLFGLFGVGAFAELARNFAGLSATARDTCLKCEGLLRHHSVPLLSAIRVLEKYDTALSRSAPLPSYAWRWNQKALAESWEKCQMAQPEANQDAARGSVQDGRGG